MQRHDIIERHYKFFFQSPKSLHSKKYLLSALAQGTIEQKDLYIIVSCSVISNSLQPHGL